MSYSPGSLTSLTHDTRCRGRQFPAKHSSPPSPRGRQGGSPLIRLFDQSLAHEAVRFAPMTTSAGWRSSGHPALGGLCSPVITQLPRLTGCVPIARVVTVGTQCPACPRGERGSEGVLGCAPVRAGTRKDAHCQPSAGASLPAATDGVPPTASSAARRRVCASISQSVIAGHWSRALTS